MKIRYNFFWTLLEITLYTSYTGMVSKTQCTDKYLDELMPHNHYKQWHFPKPTISLLLVEYVPCLVMNCEFAEMMQWINNLFSIILRCRQWRILILADSRKMSQPTCSSWSVVEFGTRSPCLFPTVILPTILHPPTEAWTTGIVLSNSFWKAE